MVGWRAGLLVVAGFAVGLGVPDLDFVLPFVVHRSAVTHSILPAVLLLAFHPLRARIACGVALGIGVHLAADSFPNAMTGYATVKLPFVRGLGRIGSYVWLGANALGALLLGGVLALRSLAAPWCVGVLGIVALGSLAYLTVTDGGWPVLAITAVVGALGWRARRQ